MLAIAINLLGSIVLSSFAVIIARQLNTPPPGIWLFALSGVVLWATIYVYYGFTLVPQNQYLVIERLRKYYRTARTGWTVLCFPGIIDSIAPNNGQFDFLYHDIDLYDNGREINFLDGSAPIRAKGYYKVDDRDHEAPSKFSYIFAESKKRISEILLGVARPMLQVFSIDEAQKNLNEINRMIREVTEKTLGEIGIVLHPERGFIIDDIILPEETRRARHLLLESEKKALSQKRLGLGYAQAITTIMKEAENIGSPITFEVAREIYETQRSFDTIAGTGANVTLVASNVRGLLKTLNLGKQ